MSASSSSALLFQYAISAAFLASSSSNASWNLLLYSSPTSKERTRFPGTAVGTGVGAHKEALLGASSISKVRLSPAEGAALGAKLGAAEGAALGSVDGAVEGTALGELLGAVLGAEDGAVGNADGATDGAAL